MNTTIRGVIFDAGNVLAKCDHHITSHGLAAHSHFSEEEIHRRVFSGMLKEAYDRGTLSPANFYLAVATEIQARDTLDYETFAHIWSDIFTTNTKLEELVARLPQDLALFLCSNTDVLHYARAIKHLGIVKRIPEEHIILSYKLGKLKPEREIYEELLSRTTIPASELLYLDDIAEYVGVWRTFGGRGFCYNMNELPISSVEEVFRSYKLL